MGPVLDSPLAAYPEPSFQTTGKQENGTINESSSITLEFIYYNKSGKFINQHLKTNSLVDIVYKLTNSNSATSVHMASDFQAKFFWHCALSSPRTGVGPEPPDTEAACQKKNLFTYNLILFKYI